MLKYSWRPDIPDQRDYKFEPRFSLRTLPSKVDLSNNYKKVYDQMALGSCTSQAIALAFDFERVKQGLKPLLPSRLFIYYNERVIEHSVPYDAGASIRDGIKTVNKTGACAETLWPYNIGKFRVKPSPTCYADASKHKVKQYLRLDNTNLNDLKSCLSQGYPFVFGFGVYSSFESPQVERTGIVPMPSMGEQMLGGHAVVCLGFSDQDQRFLCRNSWGVNWGSAGNFTIPYDYLTDTSLADDFWTVRLV